MSDKVKFNPFNPCKKCLKRPVCEKECSDLKDHSDTQECLMALSIFFGMIIFIIVGTIILAKFQVSMFYLILVLLLVVYFHSLKRLIDDGSDLEDKTFFIQCTIALFNPWGEATTYLIDMFDLDEKINKYSYRFKKNIWKRKHPGEVD